MLGSILSNILLVLGCAFWAGGWNYHEETFQATGAQAYVFVSFSFSNWLTSYQGKLGMFVSRI